MMQFLTEVIFKELDAKSAASSVSLTVKKAFIVLQGKKESFSLLHLTRFRHFVYVCKPVPLTGVQTDLL